MKILLVDPTVDQLVDFTPYKEGPAFAIGLLSIDSYPPSQKATGFRPWMKARGVPLKAHKERSGVCFGGFRLPKHVEEPWALACGAPLGKAQLRKKRGQATFYK